MCHVLQLSASLQAVGYRHWHWGLVFLALVVTISPKCTVHPVRLSLSLSFQFQFRTVKIQLVGIQLI